MFEDNRHMFKFICALLGFLSIIVPGPIVPILTLIVAIGMLIYKIKYIKESPNSFEIILLDVIVVVILLVMSLCFCIIRLSVLDEIGFSSSNSEELTIEDFAEYAILAYELENPSQFSDKGNHSKEIKSGFVTFLKNELDCDVSVVGYKITCDFVTEKVVFTVTRNDIQYSIE